MAQTRRLQTDADFQEALDRQLVIRVFENDHVVSSGGGIVRFAEDLIVIQTGVSDISYFQRSSCEFFSVRR
ncbi:hypothetical protein [Paenibacillus sp. y28]|uniref:hypothetical protein n=1 Tax=Paenibacillus sp. y28 TaxID=3129110 RepID=UPI003018AD26